MLPVQRRKEGGMSEIRRRLLTAALTADGGSWYRICPGGIYTIDNAYIDTLYKNFTNRYFEFYVDCMVMEEDVVDKGITGAVADTGSATYNGISFLRSTIIDKYYPNIYKSHQQISTSQVYDIGMARPYINKKVRVTRPFNYYNYNFYIQFYNMEQLENPIYANGQVTERYNYLCPLSMHIFGFNRNGKNYTPGNNIVIWESRAAQNGVDVYYMKACQLTRNIPAALASDNQNHYAGEYGMYDEVTGKFFGNANSVGHFIENIE